MLNFKNVFLIVFCLSFLIACSDDDVTVDGETYTYDRQEEVDWALAKKTLNGTERIDGTNLDSLSIFRKEVAYMAWDTVLAYAELDYASLEFSIIEDDKIEIFRLDSMSRDTLDYEVVDDKYILFDNTYEGFSWDGDDLIFDFFISINKRGFDFNYLDQGENVDDVLSTTLNQSRTEVGDTASALLLRYYFTR